MIITSDVSAIDPLWRAQQSLKRARYAECVDACDKLLSKNRLDMAAWVLKSRALTLQSWIDDVDMEEEIKTDTLLDTHNTTKNPRPGTSIHRPGTTAKNTTADSVSRTRPSSRIDRPPSGFARPGTAQRPGTSRSLIASSWRPGTATAKRLATAFTRVDLDADLFLQMGSRNLEEFVKNQSCTRVLCDFYLYHDCDVQKALDLCLAVQHSGVSSWWWSGRLGKCYYQLGMFQEAEACFRASLELQPMSLVYLDFAKIFLRQDQPNGALSIYRSAQMNAPSDVDCLIGTARVYDLLNDHESSSKSFREVLKTDGSNIEALASLAAHHFYADRHRTALVLYRRMLQMGVRNTEIWNNLALCALQLGRPDITLHCLTQALALSNDATVADVWYNIGHAALALGEMDISRQAWSVANHMANGHAEALNNLGVLYKRKPQELHSSKNYFHRAHSTDAEIFEPCFNSALEAVENREFHDGFGFIKKALDIRPTHPMSMKLFTELSIELSSFENAFFLK